MRGHKHLTEYLMAQARRAGVTAEREAALEAMSAALEGVATDPLAEREGAAFARAVAPWLRALRLATEEGVEWGGLPEAVDAVAGRVGRITAHRDALPRPDMRLAIDRSLAAIGLGPPPDVTAESVSFTANSWPAARRTRADGSPSPYLLPDPDAYAVLHEVFEATAEGRQDAVGLDAATLSGRLAHWLPEYGRLGEADLLAETLVALRLLGVPESDPAWRSGLASLLGMQRGNGSFGDYEDERFAASRSGYDLDVGKYLHTTEVALWALELAR